jgi:hypothetical protein
MNLRADRLLPRKPVDRPSEALMRLPALLLLLAAAALADATAPAQAAYPYYGWRQCWVTESGLGVCAPVTYERAYERTTPVRHRRGVTERRR